MAGSHYLHSTRQTGSPVHCHGANSVITDVLLHLKQKFPTVGHLYNESFINSRKKNLSIALISIEVDIDYSTDNLGDMSNILRHKIYILK